ncbi:MAG TPA: RNA methyltransferase [Saprospiraceae bacterium]|nr:RNA methyltransferase [Saprospiraceae bacterium]
MLTKNQEKYVKGLHQLKNRRRTGAFFFEGHKMAMDGFGENRLEIESIFALESWVEAYAKDLTPSLAQKLIVISEREMKKISALKTPTPILVVAQQPAMSQTISQHSEGMAALYLEGIQNPGNMGTILRVADWFGVEQVIATSDSVDFFNPKVIQASMSSIFRVKMSVMDLDMLAQKKGAASVVATAMHGTPIQKMNKEAQPMIVMIGHEGKGLSPKAFAMSDTTVTIPGHPHKKAESLNAAMAAGIICAFLGG